MRRTLPLIAMLAAETAAVVLLYLAIRDPDLAVAIACGFGAWLLGTTLVYLAARVAELPRTIAAVGRVTLPLVRRRIDRALTASILTGAFVLSGGSVALAGAPPAPESTIDITVTAAEPEPSVPEPTLPAPITDTVQETQPIVPVRSGRAGDPQAITEPSTTPFPETTTQVPSSTRPTAPPTTGSRDATRGTSPNTADESEPEGELPSSPAPNVPSVALPAASTGSYTVVPGDNLWEIAARHLAQTSGRDRGSLTNEEIRVYWVRVCDANRASIRSGDVNLIYSGEMLTLPPL